MALILLMLIISINNTMFSRIITQLGRRAVINSRFPLTRSTKRVFYRHDNIDKNVIQPDMNRSDLLLIAAVGLGYWLCSNVYQYILIETTDFDPKIIRDYEHDPAMCRRILVKKPQALQYMTVQDPDIYMAAVAENETVFHYVKNKSPDICMQAAKINGLTIRYMEKQPEDLCMEAIKQNADAIRFISDKTLKMYKESVMQVPDNINKVPFNIIYQDSYMTRILESYQKARL